jgi:hypothetical protein
VLDDDFVIATPDNLEMRIDDEHLSTVYHDCSLQ